MSTIKSLWRYPVKSMMGETLRSTNITEKGFMAIALQYWLILRQVKL